MKACILRRLRRRSQAQLPRKLETIGGLWIVALAATTLWDLGAGPGVAIAQDVVELDGSVRPTIEEKKETEHPRPRSIQKGIVPARTDVRLAAPDLAEVRGEDEEMLRQHKIRRVGIRRDLPVPISVQQGTPSHGEWIDLGIEGQVWIVTLESDEALMTRVHLQDVRVPAGSRFWVYATDDPDQVVGPISARAFRSESDHWTASLFASRVTVELDLPSSASRQDVELRVSEIVHGYVPLEDLTPELPKVDTCYNDASCDATWNDEQDGVALILVVTPLGMVQCTGCLMNDYDGDTWVDYFLTANHCLSGNSTNLGQQTAASTMEFYWFFQTPYCNGPPPPLGSVPHTTGGADLIYREPAATGNDAALVRARMESPGGIFFMGWTTSSPPVGEDTAGIHHPDGTFSRISYGDISGSTADYWLNVWNSGSTEGGSSGSPLMNSARRVIGQLYGGNASCSTMSEPDYYGRWNVTYPNVRRWFELGGTIHVDGSYSGVEEGTPTKPFDTVGEANAFAWDGARILIQGGSYPEALTFTKNVTVLGANGSVTIGY